jgi:hypothetical protein
MECEDPPDLAELAEYGREKPAQPQPPLHTQRLVSLLDKWARAPDGPPKLDITQAVAGLTKMQRHRACLNIQDLWHFLDDVAYTLNKTAKPEHAVYSDEG